MLKRFDVSSQQNRLILLTILMLALFGLMAMLFVQNREPEGVKQEDSGVTAEPIRAAVEPKLVTSEVQSGLSHPWDIVFLPNGTMLFNERDGKINRLHDGKKELVADINEVYAVGEGGLTGLALDANFSENNYIYTCYNARTASGLDVRLVRWKLSPDGKELGDKQPIITGIPSNTSGRHSGCRVRSDAEGNLWVGTGDAAQASYPQDPKSLGGKILHVTRDGMPAGNNLPAPFDPRVFSYGHRNVQGLILFEKPKDGVYGYSIEHGSDRDDEINLLRTGNFGWAPKVTYVERGIPMTDTQRFPDAVNAIWSSGSSTIAPSGGTLLSGKQWGTWDGAMAMAVLKGQEVRVIKFDAAYQVSLEKTVLEEFGRIRSATQGPDGSLYFTTDNGRNDKIIKVTPIGN